MDENMQNIFRLVEEEVGRARAKFPTNMFTLTALQEECGELAQAMMDHSRGKCHMLNVINESIQVMAMAVRIIQEGDMHHAYKPPFQLRYNPSTKEPK